MDMPGVYGVLQRIFPFAFPILWAVPSIALYFRARQKQVAYLRRFPPIDRYQTFDMASFGPGGSPPGTYRRINKAMLQRQADPELERLRREMWRRFRAFAIWVLGLPLLTFGTLILLTLTGNLPTH